MCEDRVPFSYVVWWHPVYFNVSFRLPCSSPTPSLRSITVLSSHCGLRVPSYTNRINFLRWWPSFNFGRWVHSRSWGGSGKLFLGTNRPPGIGVLVLPLPSNTHSVNSGITKVVSRNQNRNVEFYWGHNRNECSLFMEEIINFFFFSTK